MRHFIYLWGLALILTACGENGKPIEGLNGDDAPSTRGIIGPSSSTHEIKKEYKDLVDDIDKIAKKLETIEELCDGLDDRLEPFNSEVDRRSSGNVAELRMTLEQQSSDIWARRAEISNLNRSLGETRGTLYAVDKLRRFYAAYGNNARNAAFGEFLQLKKSKGYLNKRVRQATKYRDKVAVNTEEFFRRDDAVRAAQLDWYTMLEEMKVLRWYQLDPAAQALNTRFSDEISSLSQKFQETSQVIAIQVEVRNGLTQAIATTRYYLNQAVTVEKVQPVVMPMICSLVDY